MPIDRPRPQLVRTLKSELFYFAIFILFISSEALADSFISSDPFSSKKAGATEAQIRHLEFGLYIFGTDVHRLPTTEERLKVLVKPDKQIPGWKGPYLNKLIPLDPWGNEYQYYCPPKYGDSRFDLYSFGANGVDDHGDKDDITNWKRYNRDYYSSKNSPLCLNKYFDILLIFLILDFPLAVILYFVWKFYSRRRGRAG